MNPIPAKAYFALTITSIVWGTTWIGAKIGVGILHVHPLFFSSVRQFGAGIIFLLYFLLSGKARLPTLKEWGYLLMMAIIMFVLSNGLTTWSMVYINSGMGAILSAIFPFFVAIIDWIIGDKDLPHVISVCGLLVGFGGVAVIFYPHLSDFLQSSFRTGILLSLFASLSWAVGTVITTRSKVPLDRFYSLGWQMVLSGIIMYSIAAVKGYDVSFFHLSAKVWACLTYMIVIGSVVAFGAFIYSIKHLPTTLASMYGYINPIVAMILGYYILNEPLSLSLGIGVLITLAGIFLVNWGFRKQS